MHPWWERVAEAAAETCETRRARLPASCATLPDRVIEAEDAGLYMMRAITQDVRGRLERDGVAPDGGLCWQCGRPLGTGPEQCMTCAAKRREDLAR